MAINFCLPMYKPKIKTSTVSADGYEISNLISPDFRKFNQGFMAESFMKPPLSITLEFVCNISVYSVVIAPSVGRQCSSSFEIYTKSVPSNKRSLNRDSRADEGSIVTSYDSQVLVGKGFSQNPDIKLFYFENKKFNARKPFNDFSGNLANHEDNIITRQLHHHRSKALTDVSHMTIRIVRVFGATVPCLRKLEVWGQPSFSNNQTVLNSIITIFTSLKLPKELPKKKEVLKDSTDCVSFASKPEKISEAKCPEEFIDPITFEVMALPVLLPSGYTVDQSTLDRFEISNAQWGRAKADPFTGVPFSSTSKPIPNAGLKTRIDKFLLTAGKEFDTVPRTSGRLKTNIEANVSKITRSKNKVDTISNGKCQSLLESKPKRLKIENGIASSSSGRLDKHTYRAVSANVQPMAIQRNCKAIDEHISKNKISKTQTATSTTHEQKLADSLEEAMKNIEAARPNYRQVNIPNCTEAAIHFCVSCHSEPTTRNVVFYRLPCHHLMCRQCVTDRGNDACTECGLAFNNFDIVRANLS
ncbi:RING finger protein 37-like [Antedon mediterranea]|uniref:RING finger protein 37-like n=1 Tax=Antedon mediterranea TaxID=105859 RepID=UPI003AF548D6